MGKNMTVFAYTLDLGIHSITYKEKVKATLFFWYKEEAYALVTRDDIEYVFK